MSATLPYRSNCVDSSALGSVAFGGCCMEEETPGRESNLGWTPHLPFQACSWPSWRSVGPSPRSTRPACRWVRAPWLLATRTSSSAWRCSSQLWPCGTPSPTRSMPTRGWTSKVSARLLEKTPAGGARPVPHRAYPAAQGPPGVEGSGIPSKGGKGHRGEAPPALSQVRVRRVLEAGHTGLPQQVWSMETPR